MALGLVLGMRRFAGEVAEPILSSLYTIPKVTLYPVMLLIFGLGMSAKVAFGVIHGVIPVMLFTIRRSRTSSRYEMFASQRGLGFLIINGINVHDVRMTTTVTLIVVVFAVVANGLMLALDRRAHA